MLWEALFLGLLAGWLRKGSIKQLSQIYIIGWPLIIFALFVQALIWIDFHLQAYHLSSIYPYLYTGSFIVLLASIVPHRNSTGLMVIGTGILLNLVVIAANGGMMPVEGGALPPDVYKELAAGEKSPFHKPMNEQTLFAFLGDRITLFYRPNQLLSIGDLFIGAGAFIFIQRNMLDNDTKVQKGPFDKHKQHLTAQKEHQDS